MAGKGENSAGARPKIESWEISSKRSTSDYPTFVKVTVDAMNLGAEAGRKTTPNRFVLSLTRSVSSKGRPIPSES